MSRIDLRLQYEAAVKDEIESFFGRRITSYRDCIELSDDIFRKTQKQLNPNTLRRIFGLVKSDCFPSQSTLTILSKYCGYYSIEDLYNSKHKNENAAYVEQRQLLKYVATLFNEAPAKNLTDKTFLSLVKNTISFINGNADLADKFLGLIAKTKNARECYFEHFVNVDKLNSYYGNGIRYYLREKRTDEAAILAHSLYNYKYWLSGNNEKVIHHAAYCCRKTLSVAIKTPAICSRYFAAMLFYTDVATINPEETLINIYKYYSSPELAAQKEEIVSFEYVVSEALVLTGHYHDALYYLANYRKNYMKSETSGYFISLNNFKLLEALAYYQLGNRTKADEIFEAIKPSDFNFLNRKFSAILYIQLMNKLKRENPKYLETKERLVNETGFTRLGDWICAHHLPPGQAAI